VLCGSNVEDMGTESIAKVSTIRIKSNIYAGQHCEHISKSNMTTGVYSPRHSEQIRKLQQPK
jgi:hypothetical protein